MAGRCKERAQRWRGRGRRRRLAAALGLLALGILLTTAAPAPAAVTYRGVQLHSLWSDSTSADMDRELDLSQAVGANVVRVDVAWSSLQIDGPGQFEPDYVAKLDRFVDGAALRGMKVIAGLYTTPCWASSAPKSLKQNCTGTWWDRGVQYYAPTNPNDFATAARWVTARYGTKLAALEVWNEPNLSGGGNFQGPRDKPAAYTALVKATYPAVKQANAGVPVLAGALSFADRAWLDAMYANGVKGYEDGISVHPYNEWRDPYDRWQLQYRKYTFLPGLEWIHEGMLAAGDANPVWVTEFGWTTGTASRWYVTEEQQAQYIFEAFDILDTMPYVRTGIVYNLRNKGDDPADSESNFGVVKRDYTAKPSFLTLRARLTLP